MRAWFDCANGHPPRRMLAIWNLDAFECPECGNFNSYLDIYLKWRGILRPR